MKRLFPILAACLLLFSSCSGSMKDFNMTSFELVSVTPKGFSEIDMLVKIGVHNPTVGFEVTDLQGTIKVKGQEAMVLDADQLMVAGRCDKVYSVPVHGALCPGYNPFQLLNFLNNSHTIKDVTVDVNVRIAMRGGVGKKLEYKDIPIANYLKK